MTKRRIKFGALATIAVVALPIVAVVSCGKSFKVTKSTTYDEYISEINGIGDDGKVNSLTIKVGGKSFTFDKSGSSWRSDWTRTHQQFLEAVREINPTLHSNLTINGDGLEL